MRTRPIHRRTCPRPPLGIRQSILNRKLHIGGKAGPSRFHRQIPQTNAQSIEDESRPAIWSASRSNSQRASIISSALFIMVAESTVIFGPICQVGCQCPFNRDFAFQPFARPASKRSPAGRQDDPFQIAAASRLQAPEIPHCVRCRRVTESNRFSPPVASPAVPPRQAFLCSRWRPVCRIDRRPALSNRRLPRSRKPPYQYRDGWQPVQPSGPNQTSVSRGNAFPPISSRVEGSARTANRGLTC